MKGIIKKMKNKQAIIEYYKWHDNELKVCMPFKEHEYICCIIDKDNRNVWTLVNVYDYVHEEFYSSDAKIFFEKLGKYYNFNKPQKYYTEILKELGIDFTEDELNDADIFNDENNIEPVETTSEFENFNTMLKEFYEETEQE